MEAGSGDGRLPKPFAVRDCPPFMRIKGGRPMKSTEQADAKPVVKKQSEKRKLETPPKRVEKKLYEKPKLESPVVNVLSDSDPEEKQSDPPSSRRGVAEPSEEPSANPSDEKAVVEPKPVEKKQDEKRKLETPVVNVLSDSDSEKKQSDPPRESTEPSEEKGVVEPTKMKTEEVLEPKIALVAQAVEQGGEKEKSLVVFTGSDPVV